MLGVAFAVVSAAAWALNNATSRRGVITGTPIQGMSITIPLGFACFLVVALLTGEIFRLPQFPLAAAGWMAAAGLVHFVFGRYCNYRANHEAGVNLTAPVVQLQVVVTLVQAVIILGEPCTVLQVVGGLLILAGSFITQRQPPKRRSATTAAAMPVFKPRYLTGFVFASLAALGYGSSPVCARFALADTGPINSILGGVIAYSAAATVMVLVMAWPPARREVGKLQRETVRWFSYSGVLVALAQGTFYAALALAPVMVVMPILQFSLAFRLLFATWLSPDHEVFGPLVIVGAATSIAGSLMVAVDSNLILGMLAVPDAIARLLLVRIS